MNWNEVEKNVNKGPMSVLTLLIIVIVIISTAFYILGWFAESAKVTQDEFGAKSGLAKYEWFIDRSNMIIKLDNDVILFSNRIPNLEKRYIRYGEDIKSWPPHVQSLYNSDLAQANYDLLSIKSQKNGLVAEYNSASEKFNWNPFNTKEDKPKMYWDKI